MNNLKLNMQNIRKAALVTCSNGLADNEDNRKKINELIGRLNSMGIEAVLSDYIYAGADGVRSAGGRTRAKVITDMFGDSDIDAVMDVSGGDIAIEILDELDYAIIAESKAKFWGYSDLTTVINAIYSRTGKSSYLYQIRNITNQEEGKKFDDIFDVSYELINGDGMGGILVGGNIRCLLKLAGTEYLPDFTDKILFLESFGGTPALMISLLTQLKLVGAFDKIRGIILGTFTYMEKNNLTPKIEDLIMDITDKRIPIAKTWEVGHAQDSKAIEIGSYISIA